MAWTLPARAVIVTGGFSGEIFSCCGDLSGFFGAGVDLDGLPITGTFRYDTAQVPPPSFSGPVVTYQDPTFSTHFLDFSVTINGRTYTFGQFPTLPGIQSIEVTNESDQLQFDFQRFGIDEAEAISLRFISDLDFLPDTSVPTHFDFVASGIGLTPGGSFSFDLANGDSVSASFSIDSGFARVAAVPEPATLSIVALGLFGSGGFAQALSLMRKLAHSARRTAQARCALPATLTLATEEPTPDCQCRPGSRNHHTPVARLDQHE